MNYKSIPIKARRQIERLERLLQAEQEQAKKAWEGYRNALYENVDLKMKLEAVERAINGEEI